MITFAPASEVDFERLLALRIEVMRPHLERLGRYHPDRARARFREAFEPAHFRLIEVDGAFAGCVSLTAEADHYELGQFYLSPSLQGRGIGGKVLDLLLAETDAAGLPVRLHVLKQSPAARLYERHGFVRTHDEEWDIFYERAAPGGFVVTDAPDNLLKTVIDDGLKAYNLEQAGYADGRPLAIAIRDPATGKPIGGMLGRTSLGVLFVDLVFLPKDMRGQDLGSRMLSAMESEGKRRGCKSGVLFTISFQAPGFYEKHGWREFGRIPCEPPGTSRVFMTKTL
jgi:GNAT superfamily N-acetyltransferase